MDTQKTSQPTAHRCYCVVEILSGRVLYLGRYVSLAAGALEPGTCWAAAFGPDLAESMAVLEAVRFSRYYPQRAAA
jgi:hypothetical protein